MAMSAIARLCRTADAGLLFLSACTVGPDYERPHLTVPARYKEADWKVGEPLHAIDRGDA